MRKVKIIDHKRIAQWTLTIKLLAVHAVDLHSGGLPPLPLPLLPLLLL